MRSATVTLLIAAVLATGPPAALAQGEPVSQAAGNLPSSLFEAAPDGVPSRSAPADDRGTSLLLVAVAAAAGYLVARPYGSSRSTARS